MNIDDIKAKKPCPLHKLFCIIYHIECEESVEPWYKQITKLAEGTEVSSSGMSRAVIFGMYPELEKASKEWYRRYEDIHNDFENNHCKDGVLLSESLKAVSLQIGEQYGLNENRYLFNEMTKEQSERVQKLKDVEITNMCNESAEAKIDALHIIMQGLCKKLTPRDCKKLMSDFNNAQYIFNFAKDNCVEGIERSKEKCPEAYSIYTQVKKCLEKSEIKDCDQPIEGKNYKRFIQSLGSFEYNGREHNLIDVVRPIMRKRDVFGNVTEERSKAVCSFRTR